MKKVKTLKLALNKKKVSTLDASEVKGGVYSNSCLPRCTQTALYSQCGNQQCH